MDALTKCRLRSCFWREGGRCYNKFSRKTQDGYGEEMSLDLAERCEKYRKTCQDISDLQKTIVSLQGALEQLKVDLKQQEWKQGE